MSQVKTIKAAQYAIGTESDTLQTGSIGSCVVIGMYDKEHKRGGMAHAMLTTRKGTTDSDQHAPSAAKYIDEAIDTLLSDLKKLGSERKDLIAKLVGGARMFRSLHPDSEQSIGTQNIAFAKEYLSRIGIPVVSEDTGGHSGKVVEFHIATGIINVHTSL